MVKLPNGLWMGKTEVAQAQWVAIMGENPSEFQGGDNPVECVSWNDCQEFLEKINAVSSAKKSGLTFGLPAEEEWEYACRAGANPESCDYCLLPDGTEVSRDNLWQVAWFKDNSKGKLHSVGLKKSNAFGLYDMHGNVWEWTQTAVGEDRLIRGGSWDSPAGFCVSSDRYWKLPSYWHYGLGFRLCADGVAD